MPMNRLIVVLLFLSTISCKTFDYKWNLNGRTYLPVNNSYEDENWKIIISEISETEELDSTDKYLKIKLTFQNKTKKYRNLKLRQTSFSEYNFNYILRNSFIGIVNVYKKNPDLVDLEHFYRKAGVTVKLKSKLKDIPERFERYKENAKENSGLIALSCDGSNSGYDVRRPDSTSDWLAPGETAEDYISCPLPQGMTLVSIFSAGDFEIPIKNEAIYHKEINNAYGDFLK